MWEDPVTWLTTHLPFLMDMPYTHLVHILLREIHLDFGLVYVNINLFMVYTPCTDSSSLYHTNTLKPSDNEGSDTPPRHPFCHHCHYLPLTLKLRTNPHLHPSAMWAANKWHTPNVWSVCQVSLPNKSLLSRIWHWFFVVVSKYGSIESITLQKEKGRLPLMDMHHNLNV